MTINIITSSPRAVVEHVEHALEKHARVRVFVDKHGNVTVGNFYAPATDVQFARHPDQLMGNYTRQTHAYEVTQDLAQALIELTTFGVDKRRRRPKARA